MWSLATRSPNRLVTPRSSSFTLGHLPPMTQCQASARRGVGRPYRPLGQLGHPSVGVAKLRLRHDDLTTLPAGAGMASCQLARPHFGWAGEVTVILPLMMSCLSWSTAAFSVVCFTASGMFLTTVVRKTGHLSAADEQPSTSTQMTLILPAEPCAVIAEPRPVPPATGKTMSAPCATNESLIDLPLFWSVKLSEKVPFCAVLSQPSTWMLLPLVLL